MTTSCKDLSTTSSNDATLGRWEGGDHTGDGGVGGDGSGDGGVGGDDSGDGGVGGDHTGDGGVGGDDSGYSGWVEMIEVIVGGIHTTTAHHTSVM